MFGKLGLYRTVAIGAIVVGVAGWAVYSQTNWFRPAPIVEAADGPLAVAGSDVDDEAQTEDEATEDADTDEPEADIEQPERAEDAEDSSDADDAEDSSDADNAEDASDDVETDEADTDVAVDPETDQSDDADAEIADFPTPTFDVVRVESDGMTVVAGRGPAGWAVSILVDGTVVETVEIDATGQFVAILDIGESETARVITLSAKNADQILLSDAQVIIAPVVRQVEVTEDAAPVAEDTQTPEASEPEEQPAPVVVAEDTGMDSQAPEAVAEDAAETDVVAEAEAESEADTAAVEESDADTVIAEGLSVVEDAVEEMADAVVDAIETVEAATDMPATEPEADTAVSVEAEAMEPQPAPSSGVVEVATDEAAPAGDDAVEADEPMADTASATATPEDAQPVQVEDAVKDEPAPVEVVEVVEDAAPAVILVENDSVTVLQSSSNVPQVLDQLSIAAISYSDDGEVQISGFSPAGFLRVYLNNVQITVLEVPEPGQWQAELADVAPGVYTLRVDQVDAQGQVVSRVETPFQREEPEKVAEAAQSRKPLVSVEVVQPGSTLWAISRETYGSGVLYVNIFEANKEQIRNPHLIYPGQIFELPAPPGAKKKTRSSGQ
jgi:nucleoid-associated protein YgaU